MGGLCEDRRAVARIAIVDRSRSQRFEQGRSKRKLDPSDPHALRFKALLKNFLLFHDEKRADFLIANVQFLQRLSSDGRAAERRGQRGRRPDQEVSSIHSYSSKFVRPRVALVPQFCPFQGTSQVSRRRMTKVNAKAHAAMIPMPTKTTSVARNCDADMIR